MTRDNIIAEVETDSHWHDINYDEKYEPAKRREKLLHEAVCHIVVFLFTYIHTCF